MLKYARIAITTQYSFKLKKFSILEDIMLDQKTLVLPITEATCESIRWKLKSFSFKLFQNIVFITPVQKIWFVKSELHYMNISSKGEMKEVANNNLT